MKEITDNYKQEKTKGEGYQTVILDDDLTAETDGLELMQEDPLDGETKSDEEVAENTSEESDDNLPKENSLDSEEYIEDDDAYFDDEYSAI